jgi:hypothetical protein
MEKPHGGIDIKLTFEAKCYHNWTKAYNPCKYKKPNPSKTTTDVHKKSLYGFVAPKSSVITQLERLVLLFPSCRT